jgi:Histidine kinase-, DNA gyrase B-, and HSP90-like ATPase
MASVTIKTESGVVDGTPDKRVFWSIISDYGLVTGLCELVDNALDLWTLNGRTGAVTVKINLEKDRQLISVEDDAGGVTATDLRLLIAPGGSRNSPQSSIIGVFGVGSKRASVAIGEHVEIKTRRNSEETFQLDVTKDWLDAADWNIPAYRVPDIEPNTTRVQISRLRRPFGDDEVMRLKQHLSENYSWFIEKGCTIEVNRTALPPLKFDAFAFPPEFPPQRTNFDVPVEEYGDVAVSITAGLILDRDREGDNYGVYVYCNHRLIVRELRTRDVGYFVSREAGVPHPDASLARVIVELSGAAGAMPWNSSKTGINTDHPVFQLIRPAIIQLNSFFSSLSRRLKDDWEGKVFAHTQGTFQNVVPATAGGIPRFVFPTLPRVNKAWVEHLTDMNKSVIDAQPWTLGLVEAIAATDVILKQRFDTKNRIALILLDSSFEIALKEFIVHRQDLFPPATYTDAYIANLFRNRTNVVNAVKQAVPSIPQVHIDKARHFYLMRNKIVHERASVGVTDNDVASYRETVEAVLQVLFNLQFA